MLIGYLAGSIPTGYLVARWRGVDIQKAGSGNIGATNVLRTMGVVPAILVVLIDPLKAFLAVSFPLWLGMDDWTVALTAAATLLGNTYNIFLRLRGGRGVATALGTFFAIHPLLALLVLALGVLTISLGRFVSLGSLVGVFSAPFFLIAKGVYPPSSLYLTLFIAALITFRHRGNLERLAAGNERRLGGKAAPATEVE